MNGDVMARGDRMARVTAEVQEALEVGGVRCGFTMTTTSHGEFDAYAPDGTKLEIRVEVKE